MTRDLLVGTLFLGAILLVGMITVMVSGIPWGSSNYRFVVAFGEISGLQEGDGVRIRGHRLGDVEKIAFDEESVLVHIRLTERIVPREGYSFEVLPSSPLGGSYIRYIPGRGEPVVVDGPFEGRAGNDLFAVMSDILAENREGIKNSVNSLRAILDSIDKGEGIASALFRDKTIKENLTKGVENIRVITEKITDQEGVLGMLISDTEARDDLVASLESLRVSVEKIQSGEGTVGKFIHDPTWQENIGNVIARADRITLDIEDAKGLVGALLHDEALKRNFGDFANGASNIVSDIRNGDGALSRLIYDEKLGGDLSAAVHDVSQIIARVRSGPGTAYSFIYDDTLYQRANEAMALLRDTTEDVREQAPISTFFGILFAPF